MPLPNSFLRPLWESPPSHTMEFISEVVPALPSAYIFRYPTRDALIPKPCRKASRSLSLHRSSKPWAASEPWSKATCVLLLEEEGSCAQPRGTVQLPWPSWGEPNLTGRKRTPLRSHSTQFWKYPLERGKLSQHLIVKPEVLHTLFLEYIQCLQIHSNLPNEAHCTREEVTCSCRKARFSFLCNLHWPLHTHHRQCKWKKPCGCVITDCSEVALPRYCPPGEGDMQHALSLVPGMKKESQVRSANLISKRGEPHPVTSGKNGISLLTPEQNPSYSTQSTEVWAWSLHPGTPCSNYPLQRSWK